MSTTTTKRLYPGLADTNNQPVKQPKLEKNPKQWYETLPKDADIDDTLFKEPMDKILHATAEEFKTLDINYIINRYKPILSEFYELSSLYRQGAPKYNAIFENFVQKICDIYKIEREGMIVYAYKYTPKEWGNVYWEFLHLSSILLSFAFENGFIDTLLDFPTLVYNIDFILPCPKCRYHYSFIKDGDEVKRAIKRMSFGSIMQGVQEFHNIITYNVDRTPDYANRENRKPFFISDFALKYKCIDIQNETIRKSHEYIKSCIDWQPTTHTLLSIIISSYCSQPLYDRASNLLKYNLYSKNKNFTNININVRNNEIRPIDESDMYYVTMSSKQIQYCLMKALLLDFDDTNLSPTEMDQNVRLTYAIISIYKQYNNEIYDLISNVMTKPEQQAQKEAILMKFEKIKTLSINSSYTD